jgi:hypothetical protein
MAGIIDLAPTDASVISNASIPAEEPRRSAEQRAPPRYLLRSRRDWYCEIFQISIARNANTEPRVCASPAGSAL